MSSFGVAQVASDILYSVEPSSAEYTYMRLVASLTGLTLVIALSSCDSSTSSGSISNSPLVGTWVRKDSISQDSASDSYEVATITLTFSNSGSLLDGNHLTTVAEGDTLLDTGSTETGSWRATASQLYVTLSNITNTIPYTIDGDTLKLVEPNSAGSDTTLDYIRQ